MIIYFTIFIINMFFFLFISIYLETFNYNTELMLVSFAVYIKLIMNFERKINYILNLRYFVFNMLSLFFYILITFFVKTYVNNESIFNIYTIILISYFLTLYPIQYYGIANKFSKK